MSKFTVYVYRCTNGACRYIERLSGVYKAQIKCPKCGHHMMLVKMEKMNNELIQKAPESAKNCEDCRRLEKLKELMEKSQ